MRIEMSRDFTTPVTANTAWAFLRDVERLTACVPGAEEVAVIEPDQRYEGTVVDRVGPFKVRMRLFVTVEEAEEPRLLRASIRGEDRKSQTRVTGTVQAEILETGDEATSVNIGGAVDLRGPLTTLGAPIVKRRASDIFDQFVEAATRALGDESEHGAQATSARNASGHV